MKLFVGNLLSFYRLEHLNRLSSLIPVCMVITEGRSEKSRNKDFFSGNASFECIYLSASAKDKFLELRRILKEKNADEVIISGWANYADWICLLFTPKKRTSCIIESSIYESTTVGLKGLLKKIFLSRCSRVYASGNAQAEVARACGFKGQIIITGGCGILNYKEQPAYTERSEVRNFLFVGRLVSEKNLEMLIRVFNDFPALNLSIVGFGEEEERLKKIAAGNVKFIGAVENRDVWKYYREADVFVLPSKSEVWGLVVEEALNNGTPVLLSDRVGCREELLTADRGLVFRHDSLEDLKDKIQRLLDVDYYNSLRLGVSKMDFAQRAKHQVEAFL